MPKTKEEKKEIIKDLKKALEDQKSIVLINFEGLNSKTLFQMRNELKESDCQLKVVKKTLLLKTLEKLDQKEMEVKVKELKGQLGLIFGFKDEITSSKVCYKYAKDNESLEVLGGVLDKKFNDKEYVLTLANLPSQEELLSRLVGSLNYPVSSFVFSLKDSLSKLVFALKEIQKVKA